MSKFEIGYSTNETGDIYKKALERLVVKTAEGVTIYRGGPLDLGRYGIISSWLTPIMVSDDDGSTSFHIIQIGGDSIDAGRTSFELNTASDIGLKLDDQSSPQVKDLRRILEGLGGLNKTIIRPSISGKIAHPTISSPLNLAQPEAILERAKKAAKFCESDLIYDSNRLESLKDELFVSELVSGDFNFGKERRINSSLGEIFVTPVVINQGDPWGYYEVISSMSLLEARKSSKPLIRIDSGCDTGQCYHDAGCDCRSQLHNALIKEAIIVHIPSQDGRGYGMAPKMATEGGKRGIDVGYNAGCQAMDTVTAARRLLGENYDIRSYEGVGRLLLELGFSEISLFTDSHKKFQSLLNSGIKVDRVSTGTLVDGNHSAHVHVLAKHNTDHYFSDI